MQIKVGFGFLILVVIVLGLLLWRSNRKLKAAMASLPVACPMDAKTCPDGSVVGRIAPNCEFAPCVSLFKPNFQTIIA